MDERSLESLQNNHTIKNPGIPSQNPKLEVRLSETGECIGEIMIEEADGWRDYSVELKAIFGVHPLFFVYHGEKNIQMKEIFFE